MNIILFGPPGAGKGTQANNLAKKFKLHKVSTGEVLREEMKNKTPLGIKIKSIMDKGSLVSDEIINNLIEKILTNEVLKNRLIFDGYPRNLDQTQSLEILLKKYNQKISYVFSLTVDKETVIKRILGRQTCTNCGLIFNKFYKPSTAVNHSCDEKFLQTRSDDNESTISKRLETYLAKTLPVLNFYREQKLLHQINGMVEIDLISKEICDIIASLET